MSNPLRCDSCGRFIGYTEDYVFEFEPLSEFGPEKAAFVHKSCDAQGIETRSAETERLSPKGESPVPSGMRPDPIVQQRTRGQ